jgi:hypothetical protein
LSVAAGAAPAEMKMDLGAGDLQKVRKSLLDTAAQDKASAQINDQIAYERGGPSFRILSAYRLPDAVLFQRTTDINTFRRPLPTGLDLCIALGSEHAARSLDDPERDQVVKTVEQSKGLFSGSSLYCDYLRCLARLFDAPAAGAPAFMTSKPWQAKSCTTALAGWAQLRHTWMLQAKETIVWLCGEEENKPVGFVEPNPAFFEGMKKLAERTANVLARAGTHNDPRLYASAMLQNVLKFLEEKAASGQGIDETKSVREMFMLQTLRPMVEVPSREMNPKQAKEFVTRAIPIVKQVLDDIRQGKGNVQRFVPRSHRSLVGLWPHLAKVSGRLQELAEKQLAGKAFTENEKEFIRNYGRWLAPLMFHAGDPSETPRDDAPRIADVAANPAMGEYLEVGIGRPQLLYVLYPTKQGEVLCRGAVLPYYEFRSKTRLDDAEWMRQLDSAHPPQPFCLPSK